jgi:phage/plasmid-associated DNA primase
MYVRGNYKDGEEITLSFKIVLVCNEPPQAHDADTPFWNRLRILPFESTFVDPEDAPKTFEEQLRDKVFPADPNFSAKIPTMAQPFAWVLLHHLKSADKSSIDPEKVKMATARYKKRNDIYRQFIEECVTEVDQDNVKLSLQELYTAFREWYKESVGTYNIPIKNDIKEYFEKLWGSPGKGYKWDGFRIRTLQDDIENDEAFLLEADDLADYDEDHPHVLPPI